MDEEINLLEYLKVIKKWRKFIISFTCTAVILVVIISIIMPRTYRAETTILIPQQNSQGLENIMELSSMMSGTSMNMPTDLTQSLVGRATNFLDILKSRTLAETIVNGLDLKKYYRTKNNDAIIARVKNKIKVKEQKGILKISFDDRNPRLAADIVNYSVLALDEFNKRGNVQFAKRLRIFMSDQLAQSKIDLSEAEEKYKKYDTQSQMVKISEKEVQLLRLMRDVKVKEAIYTMLLQEFEKAKIDEAKEELFFEVVDPAIPPTAPYRPKPFLYSVLALIGGCGMAVFLAFLFEYLESIGIKVPEIEYERKIIWEELKKYLMIRRK